MCGSTGQREDLSSLCGVKGQDFRQTSQILFQLNSDSVFLSENLFFKPNCGFAAMSWTFAGRLVVQVGQHWWSLTPAPATLL